MKKLLTIAGGLLLVSIMQAQLRLPALVRDSMILQRDTKVSIWGSTDAGRSVTVRFKNKLYKTKADNAGNWQLYLPPTSAGGPYEMEIRSGNSILLKDILFGDVWFCSGQSNMVHQLDIHDVRYAKDIAEADYPQIRQYWIPTLTNLERPQTSLPEGYWKPAVGKDIRPFSAVALFFAKTIHEKYKIPIGIINASVGGTPIEAWTSEEGLMEFPALKEIIQKNRDTAFLKTISQTAPDASKREVKDAGLTGDIKWYEPAYTPGDWRNIHIPGYWEDQGLKDLNGVVWYRKEIDIPESFCGKPARIFLGRIVDADELYINGVLAGRTTYQYPQRRYHLPSGLLKPGKNLLVIRVSNYSGKGGFVPDKPYYLFAGNDTLALEGNWKYKVGDVFMPNTGNSGGFSRQSQPTALYNAMVAPVTRYTLKGICWYQGESNAGKPEEYKQLLPALIHDWRKKWQLGELPFLYVQLPGFMDYNFLPSESNWALLREAQSDALRVPNTGMAVALDLGEWNDIHPDNKKDVGVRLALAAMYTAYGDSLVYSGPVPDSAYRNGPDVILTFRHTGSGLTTTDGEPPSEFAVAGADRKFYWAKTRTEGNRVILSCKEVQEPVYIRYAWADNPFNPNLCNREGLPASPFRITLK